MGIFRNILWSQVGNAVALFSGFIFQILVLRSSSFEDASAYFLTLSISYFLMLPSSLGIGVLSRYFPYLNGGGKIEKAYGTLKSVFIFSFVSSLLLASAFSLYSYFSGPVFSELHGKGAFVSVLVILFFFNAFFKASLISFDMFKEANLMNSISGISKLLFFSFFLVIFGSSDYAFIMHSMFLSLVVSSIFGLYHFVRSSNLSFIFGSTPSSEELFDMAKFSLSSFVDNTRFSILSWIDIMFLGTYSTSYDVGGYGGISGFSKAISNFISGSFFYPVLVDLSTSEGKRSNSKLRFSNSLKYLSIFSAFSSGLIFSLSKEILVFLIPKYSSMYPVLQLLSFAVIFSSISSLCRASLLSKRWLKPLVFSSLLIISVDFILNFFLVPSFGSLGAALSTLASVVLEFSFFSFFSFNRNFDINRILASRVALAFFVSLPFFLISGSSLDTALLKLFLSFSFGVLFSYLFLNREFRFLSEKFFYLLSRFYRNKY